MSKSDEGEETHASGCLRSPILSGAGGRGTREERAPRALVTGGPTSGRQQGWAAGILPCSDGRQAEPGAAARQAA